MEKFPKFAEIKKRFEDSKMTLTNMTKVEGEAAASIFEQEKKIMEEHLGLKPGESGNEERLRIVDLFHGTRESHEQVISEGLDLRTLKHLGHFGRGIYFSDDPTFARLEAESESGGSPKVIYGCKVMLGNSKVYSKDETNPTLMREPRETVDGKRVTYDSVEGNVAGFTQYVVYEKRRLLVQFALTYETNEPLPLLPSLPEKSGKATATSDAESSSDDGGSGSDDGFHTPEESPLSAKEKKKRKKKKKRKEPPQIILDTLKHLMSIKSLHTKDVFDELLSLFYKTYIDWPAGEVSRPVPGLVSEAEVRPKVEEFCSVSRCTSEVEAKIFLTLCNWNVNDAAIMHFTMAT